MNMYKINLTALADSLARESRSMLTCFIACLEKNAASLAMEKAHSLMSKTPGRDLHPVADEPSPVFTA